MKEDKYDKYKLDLIHTSKLIDIFNDLRSDMKCVKDNPNYQEYLNEEIKFLDGWCDVIICAINRHDLLLDRLIRLETKLTRWLALLESDGINSKNMVATDIQKLLEEIDK